MRGDVLELIGRRRELFDEDLAAAEAEISSRIREASFLVVGGAGSIGQAVVREIFRRQPRRLHVVDVSENNLVELVRDLRSSVGYIEGEFRTLVLDFGSPEFAAYSLAEGPFDYVLNLAALKHVRSEKDPYTLMRMVDVNVLSAVELLRRAEAWGARKFFCVSTDKAANPVNMMGASKRIMEMFLTHFSRRITVSTARFANVAFSDGSLLHGFDQRLAKRQPLSAPRDVRRYFLTPRESGVLCLMSCLLGENRDIFFPKLSDRLHLITFSEIAVRYLEARGLEPVVCASEDEARARAAEGLDDGRWPCFFFDSDTTGEKDFEEFYTAGEEVDWDRFAGIGVVRAAETCDRERLEEFLDTVAAYRARKAWSKPEMVRLFARMIPEFRHQETHKYLDQRM